MDRSDFFSLGATSGEIASRTATTYFDVVNGKGTTIGYTEVTFQDEATLLHMASGTITSVGGGKKAAFEGTWEYTGGAGRFAGTKGKGTYKGERIGSVHFFI